MATLKEVTEKLAAKGKLLSQIYEEAGEDFDPAKVKCIDVKNGSDLRDKLFEMDKEVTDLKGERETLLKLETSREEAKRLTEELNNPAGSVVHPAGEKTGDKKAEVKSIGQLFVESDAYKSKGVEGHMDVETKTLMQRSAGWDPEEARTGRVVQYPLERISIVDYLPMFPTDRDLIKYMKETTFTNNAAEAAEAAQYGEAAIVLTETSDEVEKVAVWLPVTDEQLEDVVGIQDYLNQRLTYMLKARIDSQIINGDGSTPNLLGTLNLSSLQSQAKGTDPVPDAIYKAFTKVRSTGFAEPTVCLLNPNDWQDVRLLRTADGIYIFGSPTDPGPDRIWGVPVVTSTFITENTGVTGDYQMYSAIYLKRGIQFKITDAHSDYFIKGKQAIRADIRMAVVHFRDTAFCKVTGI